MKVTLKTLSELRAALDAYTGDKESALAFVARLEAEDGMTYRQMCACIAKVSSKLSVRISFSKEIWQDALQIVNDASMKPDNVAHALETHIRDVNKDKGAYSLRSFAATDVLAALQGYADLKAKKAQSLKIVSYVTRNNAEQPVWSDGYIGQRTS